MKFKQLILIHEDSVLCIVQLTQGYIGDTKMNHTEDLFHLRLTNIHHQQIRSSNNKDVLIYEDTSYIKSRDHQGGENMCCTLFPLVKVLSHWVFLTRFLTRQHL